MCEVVEGEVRLLLRVGRVGLVVGFGLLGLCCGFVLVSVIVVFDWRVNGGIVK